MCWNGHFDRYLYLKSMVGMDFQIFPLGMPLFENKYLYRFKNKLTYISDTRFGNMLMYFLNPIQVNIEHSL